MPNYTYTDDPDSAVKNKLGAKTHDELERVEAAFIFFRNAEIQDGRGPAGQFDAQHLKAIHGHLFQDVHEWAGRTRDERVALSDGTIASEPFFRKREGQSFEIGPKIGPALDDLARKLHDADHLRGLTRAAFAEQAADVMCELNAIHPFREGNGRTQRAFLKELAEQAGHTLQFSVISSARMTQASIAAHEHGDKTMMHRLFDEISDPTRVEALRGAIDSFEKHRFEWNDRYVATTEPGRSVDMIMVAQAGEHFMAHANQEILIGQTVDLPKIRPQPGESFTLIPSSWAREDGESQRGGEVELSSRDTENVSVGRAALMVVDGGLNIIGKLADIISDFLSLGATTSRAPRVSSPHARQLDERRRTAQAIKNLSESMDRGEGLNIEDLRNLSHHHLVNIAAKGDDYMRMLVQKTERERDTERRGWERGH